MPSTVSDRPLITRDASGPTVPARPIVGIGNAQIEPENDVPPATPGTSNTTELTVISPEDVRPFAQAAARDKTNKARKSVKSAIYTDTRVKNQIELDSLKKRKTCKPIEKPEPEASRKGTKGKPINKFDHVKKPARKPSKEDRHSSDDTDDDEEAFQQMQKDLEQSDDDPSDVESEAEARPRVSDLLIDDHILVKFTGRSKHCLQLTKSKKFYSFCRPMLSDCSSSPGLQ